MHPSASPVLLAMGVDPIEGLGAVRLSLGRHTRESQVDAAAEILVVGWRTCPQTSSR
jgi:cysteine sulfinate desulfinase/cysteine desulfurase-like protein